MCEDILTRLNVRLRWAESNGYEMLANDLRDTIEYINLSEMARRLARRAAEHHIDPGGPQLIEKVVKIAKGEKG